MATTNFGVAMFLHYSRARGQDKDVAAVISKYRDRYGSVGVRSMRSVSVLYELNTNNHIYSKLRAEFRRPSTILIIPFIGKPLKCILKKV